MADKKPAPATDTEPAATAAVTAEPPTRPAGTTPPEPPRGPAPVDELRPFRQLGEIVIEIGDKQNRNMLWPPGKQKLRGSWKRANLVSVTMHQSMAGMPDIPGMFIVFDGQRRTVQILDPLNAPVNKDLLDKIKAVVEEAFREKRGPEKDSREENLNPTKMKTILYWMRRFLDNDQATLMRGTMPDLEAIEELPGNTRTEVWNSSARARKFREEPDIDFNAMHAGPTGR